jgi:hypothetical protein
MRRLIIGLFAGMILTGALFIGAPSLVSVAGQPDNSSPPDDSGLTEVLPDITKAYQEAIVSSLRAAGEGTDEEIAQFSQQLIQGYGLEELPSEAAETEEIDLADLLPDIERINYTALTLPLQEAGKNIRDEEIAEFYYTFLKKSGWAIEPE